MSSRPIFSVFGPGNNGSSVLFWSIHSDHFESDAVQLFESEEQRYNKFHLHWFESLESVMAHYPDRRHRILYPVRKDVERQIISAFIRYAGRLEKRYHNLGLPPGRWKDWSNGEVIDAFRTFVELQRLPECYADYHRRFLGMFDIVPTALHSAQVHRCDQADVLIVPSEAIPESARALESFVAPARFTATSAHRTSNDRASLVKMLRPHVRTLLHRPLAALRAEYPMFYADANTQPKTGLWAHLRSLLHLPPDRAAAAH